MNSKIKVLSFLILTTLPATEGLFGQNAHADGLKFVPFEGKNLPKAAAAGDKTIRLGFCNDASGGGVIQSDGGYATYGQAITITPEVCSKYEGNFINRIDFALSKKAGRLVTVFVSKDLDADPLMTQDVYSYDAGWNTVMLDRTVKIEKGEKLYIGYLIYLNEGDPGDCMICDEEEQNGENLFTLDGVHWNGIASYFPRNNRVRAYASGGKAPANDAGVPTFIMNSYVEQNNGEKVKLKVFNYGLNTIENIRVKLEADGQVFEDAVVSDLSIAHNSVDSVVLKGVKIPIEGNFGLKATVVEVNGAVDEDASDNSKSRIGYAAKEGNKPEVRNVLFEHFVSERYEDCAISDETYSDCLSTESNVIWIKHHNDKRGGDQFTLPEDEDYKALYGKTSMFLPALALDRSYFGGMADDGPAYFVEPRQVNQMIYSCRKIPSYIRLAAEGDVREGNIDIKVSGHAGAKEMPLQKELRLTVYLVEDGIVSTEQEGRDDYVQDGVIRKVVSDVWGDPLDISAYNFEKTYTVPVQAGWNTEKMRVVAFATNYDTEAEKPSYEVYNSVQASCKSSTGIADAAAEEKGAPVVRYNGGRITVDGGYDIDSVFTVFGKEVGQRNLLPGIYVVKVSDGRNHYNVKMTIK